MTFENITSLAESFDRSLTKIAAKEKTSKKSLSKRLEKARAEHQKLSEEFKRVQKEHSGVQARFDDLKGRVGAKRKEIISLQSAGQKMDLADASDAIFHQDTNDVSYVIDGKEFHVELDGDGNVNTVPWRDHRKAQKPVEPEMTEGTEETTDEVSNAEDCADPPGEEDAANMDQAMLDDLYLKMTEEKTASYSDLIKKWGADHKEWTESSLLSGDWYKSLGDNVESFHEDEIPVELTDPTDEEFDAEIDDWEEKNYEREHQSEWHHHTQCPGKGCKQKHPRGTEPTESSYDPNVDSKLEQENVLESDGEGVEGWPEFDENLSDDRKFSNIRDPEIDAEYDGSEQKKTALRLFIAAEKAEKKAEEDYHKRVPKEEKSQERYSKWMTPFWKDVDEAYKYYHSLGGRLGA